MQYYCIVISEKFSRQKETSDRTFDPHYNEKEKDSLESGRFATLLVAFTEPSL